MNRYPESIREKVRRLRSKGKTYGEIRSVLNISFPKSTLSGWCQEVKLPDEYIQMISNLNLRTLNKARATAVAINKLKRQEFFQRIITLNKPIAEKVSNKDIAKIALSILCLGEASKYKPSGTGFYLGSSDPRIVILFLNLLKACYDFKIEKVRCTVQCRADQNIPELELYWQNITKIPKKYFYNTRVDPRTIGKPTKKTSYKGVLKVNYSSTEIQLDLESLADLIYNQVL